MVQITTFSGGRLSSVDGSVAGAGRVAEAIKGTSSAGDRPRGDDGAGVERDRQHLAASGKFVAEGKARSTANANAAEGATLLQIADDALESIETRLDRLAAIALAAEQSGLSTGDRARMDLEFQTLKGEIDTIAADTSFDSIKLLQGGAGPGGVFEVSFKVGTGNGAEDEITISIAPASVEDLSAGLAAGGVTSMAGATTARTTVAAAQDSLGIIRAGVAGDMERLSIASRNNSIMRREHEATRDMMTAPAVVIDLARVVAQRTAEDGGYQLSDRTVDQMRKLLINLGDRNAERERASHDGEEAPPAPSAQPRADNINNSKDAA